MSKPDANEIAFTTLPQEEYTAESAAAVYSNVAAQPGFAAASEGGFFFADANGQAGRIATGVCNVTGARGFLRFQAQ